MAARQLAAIVAVSFSLSLHEGRLHGRQQEDDNVPTLEVKPAHVLKLSINPQSFTFSRNGKRLVCEDGRCGRVWDTRTWKQLAVFSDGPHLIHCVVLSPDGRMVAFTSSTGEDIHLLDVALGTVVRTLKGHENSVHHSPTFSPDGKTLASHADNDGVKLWDVQTGKDLDRFKNVDRFSTQHASLRRLVFSPDGNTLVAATMDGTLHLLDVQAGKESRAFSPTDPRPGWPEGVAFSPDGRLLAVGSIDRGNVTIWNVSTGKTILQLRWPEWRLPNKAGRLEPEDFVGGSTSLAFSPDGRSLLAACRDRQIRVWEMSTGGLRYKVQQSAWDLAVPPNAFAFATSGEAEKTLAVWDFRTWLAPTRPPAPLEVEKAWSALDSPDSARAYERMRALASAPAQTLLFLDKRLPTAQPVQPAIVEGLIKDLDKDEFSTRQRAKRQLAELGELAKPSLLKALAQDPSREARQCTNELLQTLNGPPVGDRLRFVRAIEVLESIGTHEAIRVLKRLAEGEPSALLTREAKTAVERLQTHDR